MNIEESNVKTDQEKFEEKHDFYWDELSNRCSENKVDTAIAILIDPEMGDEAPIVFSIGHKYEKAKLLARLLRILKNDIYKELEI